MHFVISNGESEYELWRSNGDGYLCDMFEHDKSQLNRIIKRTQPAFLEYEGKDKQIKEIVERYNRAHGCFYYK